MNYKLSALSTAISLALFMSPALYAEELDNKKEKEILSCGTMGGDAQDQWQAQFLMNYIFFYK